jgi:hypothetical protein
LGALDSLSFNSSSISVVVTVSDDAALHHMHGSGDGTTAGATAASPPAASAISKAANLSALPTTTRVVRRIKRKLRKLHNQLAGLQARPLLRFPRVHGDV